MFSLPFIVSVFIDKTIKCCCLFLFLFHNKKQFDLCRAELIERQSAGREVAGSNPGHPFDADMNTA